MSYPITDERDHPQFTPAVTWLIAINVAIFFVQRTVVGDGDMQRALGFEVRDLTDSWWTIFTYMFVHGGFWHLALNMYALWMFGPRVEAQWSSGAFVRYYVLCGLGGWFAHLLLSRNSLLVGASAAIFGVMLAYAMRWPDDELYLFFAIPIKVKWFVAILAVLSLLLGIQGAGTLGGGTAHIAHFGGFAAGWLYLRTPSAQSIERLKQRISPAADIPDDAPPRAVPRSLPRSRDKVQEIDEIVAKSRAVITRRPPAQRPVEKPAPNRAEELNLVLDKISEQGLDSLTSDERRLLEEMSKRLRE